MGGPSVSAWRARGQRAAHALVWLGRGALLLVCALLASRAAYAQTAEETARARLAYARGQECYRAADYPAAQLAFEEAYQAVRNPVVLLGIAESQLKREHWSSARETLERYLRERPDAPDRAKVSAQIEELKTLSIETGPPVMASDANITSEPREVQVSAALPADENKSVAPLLPSPEPHKPAPSHAVLIHENRMSRSYRLVSATYKINGKPVFARTDDQGGLGAQPALRVFDADLPAGSHKLDVELSYRGEGFGLFSYMRERKFTVRSSYAFTTRPEEVLHLTAVAYEKGGPLVPLEDRPSLRYVRRAEKHPRADLRGR